MRRGKSVLDVDFDPDVLDKWRQRDMSVLYGDMSDPDIYKQLPLDKARW
ncbi:NAD-binding protein [Desulfosoma sp.]